MTGARQFCAIRTYLSNAAKHGRVAESWAFTRREPGLTRLGLRCKVRQ